MSIFENLDVIIEGAAFPYGASPRNALDTFIDGTHNEAATSLVHQSTLLCVFRLYDAHHAS